MGCFQVDGSLLGLARTIYILCIHGHILQWFHQKFNHMRHAYTLLARIIHIRCMHGHFLQWFHQKFNHMRHAYTLLARIIHIRCIHRHCLQWFHQTFNHKQHVCTFLANPTHTVRRTCVMIMLRQNMANASFLVLRLFTWSYPTHPDPFLCRMCVGLAITVFLRCMWPNVWWFPCWNMPYIHRDVWFLTNPDMRGTG